MTVAIDDWRDRISVPTVVLGELVVAVAAALVVAATPTSSYGPYNDE